MTYFQCKIEIISFLFPEVNACLFKRFWISNHVLKNSLMKFFFIPIGGGIETLSFFDPLRELAHIFLNIIYFFIRLRNLVNKFSLFQKRGQNLKMIVTFFFFFFPNNSYLEAWFSPLTAFSLGLEYAPES